MMTKENIPISCSDLAVAALHPLNGHPHKSVECLLHWDGRGAAFFGTSQLAFGIVAPAEQRTL